MDGDNRNKAEADADYLIPNPGKADIGDAREQGESEDGGEDETEAESAGME